jgi:PPM family protein phosphatase
MIFNIESSLKTNIGRCRGQNEDSIGAFSLGKNTGKTTDGFLTVLADGMGGHKGGDVASRMAVDIVGKTFLAQQQVNTVEVLQTCLVEANQAIYDRAKLDPAFKGMGSTCTVLYIKDDKAGFAHIGDSRLYCLRDKMLQLLTEDHTLVNEMLRDGLISADEARNHPDRSIVTRALGTVENVDISTSEGLFTVQAGDIYLLCSDGLYDLVDDDEIQQALINYLPQSAAKHLIDLANERGGYDNISVGIIAILASSSETKRNAKPRETSPAIL